MLRNTQNTRFKTRIYEPKGKLHFAEIQYPCVNFICTLSVTPISKLLCNSYILRFTHILYLVCYLKIFCMIFYSDVIISQVQILDSDKRIHSPGKDEIY